MKLSAKQCHDRGVRFYHVRARGADGAVAATGGMTIAFHRLPANESVDVAVAICKATVGKKNSKYYQRGDNYKRKTGAAISGGRVLLSPSHHYNVASFGEALAGIAAELSLKTDTNGQHYVDAL